MTRDEILDSLLRARGLDRYATFWETPEGRDMPNGIEEESGHVIAIDGRVFFWWLGWDAEQNAPHFKYWDDVLPDPSWAESAEYLRACERIGVRETSRTS